MELRCYEDGRPISPGEQAILAVRRSPDAVAPGTAGTQAVPQEMALFHVDCHPAEPGEWVRLRQGQAGLLHDAPP